MECSMAESTVMVVVVKENADTIAPTRSKQLSVKLPRMVCRITCRVRVETMRFAGTRPSSHASPLSARRRLYSRRCSKQRRERMHVDGEPLRHWRRPRPARPPRHTLST